jgi:hypothetical protein
MTRTDAEGIIRSVGRGALNISYGAHFWKRVSERTPGFTRLDAMNILRRGEILSDPQWSEEHRNFRVKVRGRTDHGRITIVVAIAFLDDAYGVTMYPD